MEKILATPKFRRKKFGEDFRRNFFLPKFLGFNVLAFLSFLRYLKQRNGKIFPFFMRGRAAGELDLT